MDNTPTNMLDFDKAKETHEQHLLQGDHIVRGTAADGMIRAFAINSRQTVQEIRDRHHTTPVATAALGRLITGAQMMGTMFKNADELITLMVQGDGPLGSMTVTANTHGQAKGFAAYPDVWLPLNDLGKLDVGAAVGQGTLTVVRDRPGIEPYCSQIQLVTGEIGDDLTSYFILSDQVPTVVGVGVLVGNDLSVKQAGGFIIQLMPGFSEETAEALERNLTGVSSVTAMMEEGLTPTQILERLLDGLEFERLEVTPAEFYCGCSKTRASRSVLALGVEEIEDMIEKGEPADIHCHFCGSHYHFDVEELAEMIKDDEED